MPSFLARRSRPLFLASVALSLAALGACGGHDTSAANNGSAPPPASGSLTVPSSTPLTPDPGGKIVTVQLVSDEKGNYFAPAEVHAKRGDVVRFTLKVGVHDVDFLPDSNIGRADYPHSPSDLLQLPGQSVDVAVKMAPGTYYFQCDPHAALGMRGRLIVE